MRRLRDMPPMPPGNAALTGLLVLSLQLASGCSPDMKDGLGPRAPVPTVTGTVVRRGAAAAQLQVELRDPLTSARLQSTRTGADGSYGLAAQPGSWELRVSGASGTDFASVTREFSTPDGVVRIPAIDISSYGAALMSPSDRAAVPRPGAADSLAFRWRSPSRSLLSSRVQLYDSTGAAVWYSAPTRDSTAFWNGVENQGSGSGSEAPSGRYTWRVKFSFPDTTEGRTERREIVLP